MVVGVREPWGGPELAAWAGRGSGLMHAGERGTQDSIEEVEAALCPASQQARRCLAVRCRKLMQARHRAADGVPAPTEQT
jgi:hypothetical protein